MIQTLIQLPIGFIIGLSGSLIPGPLLAYTMAKSPDYGARTGPLAVVGHVLVELVILSLISLGLGVILQASTFQAGFGLFGGVMLVLLGFDGISKLRKNPSPSKMVATKHHPVLGGILYSTILNPTVIFWWATIGVATIMEAYLVASLAGVVLWLVGHFLSDLIWFSLVSLSVVKGKKVIGVRGYRAILSFCTLLLFVLGVYFLFKYGQLLF
ncbi:MAG: LysE family transporter [Candidatus Hadarchaeum sp.]|uniref:LysE family transporter n=1 Tax=Candidatus Hadarchaeum sp. TaxID=2883567 RepID=UPI003D0F6409